jgi:lysophospholipase L1-like esterase
MPAGAMGARKPREGFLQRHGTGVTVILFGLGCVALGLAPIPDRFKPFNLTNKSELVAMKERVLRKPKLTFAQRDAPAILMSEEDEDVVVAPSEAPKDPVLAAAIDPAMATPIPGKPARKYERPRQEPPPSKQVAHLRKLSGQLKAAGSDVENPCIKKGASGCERTALDPFFASLDAVVRQEEGAHATVVTLGNSLIASDHVTDIVRERLVENFGDAGRGYLLPDRLSKLGGRRVRTGRGTPGWNIHTFAQKQPKRADFGFAGSMHESSKKGDRVRWALRGAQQARLFWLDHEKSAEFSVYVDDNHLLDVKPERPASAQDRILDLDLPSGGKNLVLKAGGSGVVLYGVALSNQEPGVTWDTIGVPASDAEMYMKVDEGRFSRQLAAREPSLVVVMIGGNETRSLAFKWTTVDEIRGHYGALLDRVKAAAPDAACLAVSPIDAAKATSAGAQLTTRKEVMKVVAMEREVAAEKGCAFFDLFGAMGGEGSLQRFHRRGLVNDDLVHPKGKGGDVMGQLFADALLNSYRATALPAEEVQVRRRLVRPRLVALDAPGGRPEVALSSFFSKLHQADKSRVAVGFFGDTHVAAQQLTDRVRERLQDQFGSAGRGWVPVGRASPSLLPSRVTRSLRGRFDVTDGRDVRQGGAMSMAGTKIRLLPGGRTSVTFCDGCDARGATAFRRAGARGSLELGWLYTPDMGIADVFVNDVWVGVLSPAERRTKTDVQFFRVPVRGEAHTVSVQVRDPQADPEESAYAISTDRAGPVNVFGVASEVKVPGVVVDAIGAEGTTAMTMQRWRRDVIEEQVASRGYDLVVSMWGTEEAGLKGLDEVTYRHHAGATLDSLLEASPRASCLVMGPPPRVVPRKGGGMREAPRLGLVSRVLRELSDERGCAYFALDKAMRGGFDRWTKGGLALPDGAHLSREGYARVGDLLVDEVVGLWTYLDRKAEQDKLKQVELAKAEEGED